MAQFRLDRPVVLVCGGRKYKDRNNLFKILDELSDSIGEFIVLHGAAEGADSLAERYAKDREYAYIGVPAKWNKLGPFKAGNYRNRRMAYVFTPDIVVAFPGGTGTDDMVELADQNKIKIMDFR